MVGAPGAAVGFTRVATGPTYRRTGFLGKACLEFDPGLSGANNSMSLAHGSDTTLDAVSATNQSFSITLIVQPTIIRNFSTIFSKTTTSSSKIFLLFDSLASNDTKVARYSDLYSTNRVIHLNVPHLIHFTFATGGTNTGTESLYMDGVLVGTRTGVVPAPDGSQAWRIGAVGAGLPLSGKVPQIVVDNAALTQTDIDNDLLYWKSYYSPAAQVLCGIDSRTFGVNSIEAGSVSVFPWPTQLATLLAAQFPAATVYNAGLSGSLLQGWVSTNFATLAQPFISKLRNEIAVIFGGYNDFAGARTTAQAAADMVTLEGMFQTAGSKTIVLTEVDFSGAAASTDQTWRAGFRTAVLASLTNVPGTRLICDSGSANSSPVMGVVGASDNTTTLYDSSKVHMRGIDSIGNPAGGYREMAVLIMPFVIQMLTGGPGTLPSVGVVSPPPRQIVGGWIS
jgi:hypothetical protein